MSQLTYLVPGTVLLGRYEIRREIGRGGYSIVYLAHDQHIAASVAVKLLVPPPAAARVARERMRREVQSVRGISDPAIVAVYDFGDDGPWSFIVMEYVPGPDLSVRVREGGPLRAAEAASIGRDIAGALAAAHRSGVLHRDVKPQNILLDPLGRGRLTDFGSARLADQTTLTGTGGLIGTPEYAAPEVFAGHRGDARSDVYGLGLSLYFALTGALPARSSPHAPPSVRPEGHHPRLMRPEVPDWLDGVIARSTAADPEDRFSGATAFATALAAGDNRTGLEPALPPAEKCLACAGLDPLGLGICPRCSGSGAQDGDTLIFARATTPQALATVLGPGTRGSEARVAAEGARPLVLVPAAAASQVIDRLGERGIAARAVPRRQAWSAAPVGNYVLAAAVLLAGVGAGTAISAALFVPSPVLALLLIGSAVRAARRPVAGESGARNRGVRLPVELRAKVVSTLAELPPGTARSLLGRLVRRAAALLSSPPSPLSLRPHSSSPPYPLSLGARSSPPNPLSLRERGDAAATIVAAGIETMVVVACGAALELMRLEHVADATPGSEAQARSESARDKLVQRLLDADAALGRLQSGLAAEADKELQTVTAELEREAKIQAEASEDVRKLLRSP